MIFFEPVALIISSFLTFVTLYFKIPTKTLQQIIAILLVFLLIFVSRFLFTNSSRAKKHWVRLLLLSLSSSLVQLLVISSGGFYSPFLILIHLFTLGTSFLFSTVSSSIFLVLSILLLFAQIQLDPNIHKFFSDDPWSVVLYCISFLVVVPLAFLLMRSYHLKDTLSKLLEEYIQLGKLREESILGGLSELVLVTDVHLGILYINSAAEKELNLTSSQALNRSFLSLVTLKDAKGNSPTLADLMIDQLLKDQTTRVINDFYFYGKTRSRVSLRIRPITDLQGKISQLVFVITDAKSEAIDLGNHENLDHARNKFAAITEEFRKGLMFAKNRQMQTEFELMTKINDDIEVASELEDHPIKPNIEFKDVTLLLKQSITTKQNLAQSLGVPLSLSLDTNEVSEAALLSLAQNEQLANSIPSDFMIISDFRYLGIMINHLIDMALLLSLGENHPLVTVQLYRQASTITIAITTPTSRVQPELEGELFKEYYPKLITNLRIGSGLEGFISQRIATQLKIPLQAKVHPLTHHLVFLLSLNRKPI